MKRKLLVSIAVSVIAGGSLLLAVTLAGSRPETNLGPEPTRQTGRTIRVTPWGASQQAIDSAKAAAITHPSVQRYVRGTRHRLLHFEFLEAAAKPVGRSEPPSRYRVTIFDYTNNRAIIAGGRFDDRKLEVTTELAQPLPSEEEFDEAVAILRQDPELGPRIIEKSLLPYNPMPPIAGDGTSRSRPDRTLTVGLLPKEGGADHKIVGINMVRQTVVTYAGGAPPTSSAAPLHCGASEASQPTTPRGTAGQFEVVISRDGAGLLRFAVTVTLLSSLTIIAVASMLSLFLAVDDSKHFAEPMQMALWAILPLALITLGRGIGRMLHTPLLAFFPQEVLFPVLLLFMVGAFAITGIGRSAGMVLFAVVISLSIVTVGQLARLLRCLPPQVRTARPQCKGTSMGPCSRPNGRPVRAWAAHGALGRAHGRNVSPP